jgi:hypothetical protein
MSTTIKFEFNTALSNVDPENGKFDEKAFDELAKKIRGHIMSQPSGDGISGMQIARYGMRVEYESGSTTREQVISAVAEGIEWASSSLNEAFPLREGKTPTVSPEPAYVKKPTGETSIIARLSTNLYRRPVGEESRTSLRNEIAEKLVDLDGITDFEVAMNGVSVVISNSITSAEVVKQHIAKVLQGFADDVNGRILPFAKSTPVNIEWEVTVQMR